MNPIILDDLPAIQSSRIAVRIPTAMEMIGLKRSKLYQFLQSGEIETIKVGRATLVVVDSLHQFVESRRQVRASE